MSRLAKLVGYIVLGWGAALALIELDWRAHRAGRNDEVSE